VAAARGVLLTGLLAAGCAAGPSSRAHTPPLANAVLPAPAGRSGARLALGGPPGTKEPAVANPAAVPGPAPAATPTPAAAAELDASLTSDEPARCPPDMALVLGAVCVDRWEGSLVEVLPGGAERAYSPFQTLDPQIVVRAVSRPGVIPQAYISGADAEKACQASGKRLCTAREWEVACRGPARTTYPYGAVREEKRCNDDGRKVHPVADVTKRLGLPEDRMWYENMGNPLINQLPDTLDKTGEHATCTNEYGAYDMVGNLHEWLEDPEGTFRGGFYMDTVQNGEGCSYATTAHAKTYHDYSTGFRCCLDADPVE
jgi:sulfatase-modifying factor enzyme 1